MLIFYWDMCLKNFSLNIFLSSLLTCNLWNCVLVQKVLDPSVFKIGCSQAGKNKWVDMGKQVSRKVIIVKTFDNSIMNAHVLFDYVSL